VSYTGAARTDLDEHDWQDPVRDLMRPAPVVVLVLGSGRGAMWELCEAMRIVEPTRLLLLAPLRRDEYERVRADATVALSEWTEHLRRESGKRWSPPRLPEYEEARLNAQIRGVIYFLPGWYPTYSALKDTGLSYGALRGSLLVAMRPFFAQLEDAVAAADDVMFAAQTGAIDG
jgi:hypothetical protein